MDAAVLGYFIGVSAVFHTLESVFSQTVFQVVGAILRQITQPQPFDSETPTQLPVKTFIALPMIRDSVADRGAHTAESLEVVALICTEDQNNIRHLVLGQFESLLVGLSCSPL